MAAIEDYPWDEAEERLLKAVQPHYLALMRVGHGAAADVLDGVEGVPGIEWDQERPEVQRVLGKLAKRVTAITGTTRDEIRALVGKAAEEGEGPDVLARWVRQLGEIAADADSSHARRRSEMIARTESATAATEGSILAYEESGVVAGMEWLASADGCPDCTALDGQRVKLGEDWDGVQPPAHPDCRCAITPVLTSEWED